MDRSRIPLLVAAVVTAAVAVFAVGAAVTSTEDGDAAPVTAISLPATPTSSVATTAPGSVGSGPGDSVAGTAPAAAEPAARVDIEIAGFQFLPGDVTVEAGTEVVWTNNDTDVHSIVPDEGTFGSPVFDNGETFSFVFDTPGTYAYSCGIHPSMTGTITVEG